MRRIAALTFALALAASAVWAQGAAPSQEAPPKVSWMASLDEAKKAAKPDRKPILLNFFRKIDLSSKSQDTSIFQKPEVVAALAEFVCVRLDPTKNKDEAERFNVAKAPESRFLDWKGEPIEGIDAVVKIKNAKEFLALLEQVRSRIDKKRKEEDSRVTWRSSLAEGIQEARERKTLIFLYFTQKG